MKKKLTGLELSSSSDAITFCLCIVRLLEMPALTNSVIFPPSVQTPSKTLFPYNNNNLIPTSSHSNLHSQSHPSTIPTRTSPSVRSASFLDQCTIHSGNRNENKIMFKLIRLAVLSVMEIFNYKRLLLSYSVDIIIMRSV